MNHRTPLLCQRWRERRSSYRPAGETINPSDFEIARIDEPIAKQFVKAHHYTKSFVVARYCYGLFSRHVTPEHWETFGLAPQLVGVAAFSVPQHPAVLTNVFPGDPNDSIQLGRFILLDHVKANAESYFILRCNELLKKEGLRGVLAFSDDTPRLIKDNQLLWPGHLGIIYQSIGGKALFLGRGARKTLHVFEDGTALEPRALSKIRNKESGIEYASKLLRDRGADEVWPNRKDWLNYWLPKLTTPMRHPGNLRYAWALANKVIPVGRPLPYPKRFATEKEMLEAKEKAASEAATKESDSTTHSQTVDTKFLSKSPKSSVVTQPHSRTRRKNTARQRTFRPLKKSTKVKENAGN